MLLAVDPTALYARQTTAASGAVALMTHGLISEADIQSATDRLRDITSEKICGQFFSRERLARLERMVGGQIAREFLLDLIGRQ